MDNDCDRICDRCLTTFICGPSPIPCRHPGCGGTMITWPEYNAIREQGASRAARLAALKAAVVAAAKLVDGQYASLIKHGRASRALCDLHAACAALAKAEADK